VSLFCLGCGNSLTESDRFCPVCGRDSQAGANVPPVDPAVAFGLPPETSGKAIFSLICGILFIILPFSVVAVIFGHIALSEIRKNPARLTGRGLAITGIVLGYVGVVLLVGFIGLMIYGVRQAEKEINTSAVVSKESSIVSSLRTVNMAEIAYGQAHHDAGFTCSLEDLAGSWGMNKELVSGKSHGYVFQLENCSAAKPGGPISKYQLFVYSSRAGGAGAAAYCTDQSDVIRVLRKGNPRDCFATGTELSAKEINNPQVRLPSPD